MPISLEIPKLRAQPPPSIVSLNFLSGVRCVLILTPQKGGEKNKGEQQEEEGGKIEARLPESDAAAPSWAEIGLLCSIPRGLKPFAKRKT